MIIDFKNMEEKAIPHFQNGEGEFNAKIFNDGTNKILMGRLKKGNTIGLHTHNGSSEIIYVLEGEGLMICDEKEEILKPGDVHYCENGHSHTFKNVKDADLKFFAVVPVHGKN